MLSPADLRNILPANCWMSKLDLKNAYWHVPIDRRFKSFLAFQAGENIYRFKVLPFGLNIAPRVFTQMMKHAKKKFMAHGVTLEMYLDNWIVYAESQEQCVQMTYKVISLAEDMGLLFNFPKSNLLPSQEIIYLGFKWNSLNQTLSLSEDNQNRISVKVSRALTSDQMTQRQWESILGSTNFQNSVTNFGRVRHKRLHVEGRKVFCSEDARHFSFISSSFERSFELVDSSRKPGSSIPMEESSSLNDTHKMFHLGAGVSDHSGSSGLKNLVFTSTDISTTAIRRIVVHTTSSTMNTLRDGVV